MSTAIFRSVTCAKCNEPIMKSLVDGQISHTALIGHCGHIICLSCTDLTIPQMPMQEYTIPFSKLKGSCPICLKCVWIRNMDMLNATHVVELLAASLSILLDKQKQIEQRLDANILKEYPVSKIPFSSSGKSHPPYSSTKSPLFTLPGLDDNLKNNVQNQANHQEKVVSATAATSSDKTLRMHHSLKTSPLHQGRRDSHLGPNRGSSCIEQVNENVNLKMNHQYDNDDTKKQEDGLNFGQLNLIDYKTTRPGLVGKYLSSPSHQRTNPVNHIELNHQKKQPTQLTGRSNGKGLASQVAPKLQSIYSSISQKRQKNQLNSLPSRNTPMSLICPTKN